MGVVEVAPRLRPLLIRIRRRERADHRAELSVRASRQPGHWFQHELEVADMRTQRLAERRRALRAECLAGDEPDAQPRERLLNDLRLLDWQTHLENWIESNQPSAVPRNQRVVLPPDDRLEHRQR